MEYIFTLKYQLADDDRDSDALVERLGEAGCDDALVGIGQPGRLALEFTREATDAEAAVRSAWPISWVFPGRTCASSCWRIRAAFLRRCTRAVRRFGTWPTY